MPNPPKLPDIDISDLPDVDVSNLPDEEGLFSKAINLATNPITNLPSIGARMATNAVPRYDVAAQRLNDLVPGMDYGTRIQQLVGFGKGAVEGASDVLSGLTSPANLALLLLTGGQSAAASRNLPMLAKLAGLGARAVSAPVAAEGAYHLYNAPDLAGKLRAIPEIAGGLAGMATPLGARGPQVLPAEPTTNIRGLLTTNRQFEAPPINKPDIIVPPRNIPAGPSSLQAEFEAATGQLPANVPTAVPAEFATHVQPEVGTGPFMQGPSPLGEQKFLPKPRPIEQGASPLGEQIQLPEQTATSAAALEDMRNRVLDTQMERERLAEQQLEESIPATHLPEEPVSEEPSLVWNEQYDAMPVEDRVQIPELRDTFLARIRARLLRDEPVNIDDLSNAGDKLDFQPEEIPFEQSSLYGDDALPSAKDFGKPTPAPQAETPIPPTIANAAAPKVSKHTEALGKFIAALNSAAGPTNLPKLRLNANEVELLTDLINKNGKLKPYEVPFALEGLIRTLHGKIPSHYSLDLMERAMGKQVTSTIIDKLPKTNRDTWAKLVDVSNLPRALQASFDLSFPLRQGIGLIHKKAWWTSWDDMLKSASSEEAYKAVMDSIYENPIFQRTVAGTKIKQSFAEQAGLHMTDLADLSRREEAIMSNLAEKIPGVGRPVRASNRAYTAFANKLRADTFTSMIKDAERIYEGAKASAKNAAELAEAEKLNPNTNLGLAKEIANFINNASGRGNLAGLEQHALALNALFFSPRLIMSRVQMLNPANYIKGSPQVRQAYLKSMLATAGTWWTLAEMAEMAGADVSKDPTNADFGKIKIGNARLDPGGGFQQYLVLLSRMATGEMTSSVTGRTRELGRGYNAPTRFDVGLNFLLNKSNPLVRFGTDMAKASNYRPFGLGDRTIQMFTPMLIQDMVDIAKEDPKLIAPFIALDAIGAGSQVYEKGSEPLILPEEYDLTLGKR